jgi:hypothetical protein
MLVYARARTLEDMRAHMRVHLCDLVRMGFGLSLCDHRMRICSHASTRTHTLSRARIYMKCNVALLTSGRIRADAYAQRLMRICGVTCERAYDMRTACIWHGMHIVYCVQHHHGQYHHGQYHDVQYIHVHRPHAPCCSVCVGMRIARTRHAKTKRTQRTQRTQARARHANSHAIHMSYA